MTWVLWHGIFPLAYNSKKLQIDALNRGFAGRPIQLDGYNGERIVVDSKIG
jgi:hypothetical protein